MSNLFASEFGRGLSVKDSFVFTSQYERFREFCVACEKNRYIGLCYGPPGVGKSLSARFFTSWDDVERFNPAMIDPSLLIDLRDRFSRPSPILYTPSVSNSPRQVNDGIAWARLRVYNIAEEHIRFENEARLTKLRDRLADIDEQEHKDHDAYKASSEEYHNALDYYRRLRESLPKPRTSLVIIDEADRLKMSSLEEVRDIYDRSDAGLILIGMPGLEKRLARYPQLYSRVGFVHEFGPLRKTEVLEVLKTSWRPNGVDLPPGAFTEDGLAAIVRTVSGNFRLLHRLLTQIARVMEINDIDRVTAQVVDAARESLVIGVCA
ncbi:MAG: AAA family ATPase [Methyloceanibacter sp.]